MKQSVKKSEETLKTNDEFKQKLNKIKESLIAICFNNESKWTLDINAKIVELGINTNDSNC